MATSLTRADRCDRCSAAAAVTAYKGVLMLLFCSHHGREYFPALDRAGWEIWDEAGMIEPATT